jgi:hydrogenase-4 component B
VFAQIYRPTRELTIDFHPESKYFVQSIAYRSEITPWIERVIYGPIVQGVAALAQQVRRLQAGSLHLYIAYIAIVLAVLLLIARGL